MNDDCFNWFGMNCVYYFIKQAVFGLKTIGSKAHFALLPIVFLKIQKWILFFQS
jgi:hypothetical protein